MSAISEGRALKFPFKKLEIKAVQGRQNLVFWNRKIFDEPSTMAAAN